MAYQIVAAIHQRIEEILADVVSSSIGWRLEQDSAHLKCNPRSYHVTFGNNESEGEVVSFERYCKCEAGVINARVTRSAFEDNDALRECVKAQKQRKLEAESQDREWRYKQYLELKKEFQWLDK